MSPKTNYIAIGLLALSFALESRAQYFGERVLEKSFEQTDFFFSPMHLSPYGIGGFQAVSVGLFDDRLTLLALNPAYFSLDDASDHYAYLDFRSVSEIRSQTGFSYYPMLDYRMAPSVDMIAYPRYFFDTRKELQPVFAGAYLTRPLPALLPNLFIGVTYQFMLQDDQYYAIPQDIYRTALGYDYTGARASPENLPIVDRYKGSNDMHHLGHFVSFFSGYELTDDLQLGVKLGKATFGRDGSFGSQNLWDGYYNPNYQSLWSNFESREQEYKHWDFTAGLRYRASEHDELGVTLGYLTGTAAQQLARTDSSFYGSGTVGVGTNWSSYMRSGITDQVWNHGGRTTYGGVQLLRILSPSVTLNLQYGFQRQHVDIDLRSLIRDTSYNNYRYQYNDTFVYRSEGFSALTDDRGGAGTNASTAHRFFAALHWETGERSRLILGLQLATRQSELTTSENVLAQRRWQYQSSSGQDVYESSDATLEDKELLWTFTTDITTLQIPVVFQWQASEQVDLLLGFTRTMSSWTIEDVTLAVVRLRDRTGTWGSDRRENFGERYTMPKERVSDVRTAALLGLTVRPASLFTVRLLATPNIVNDFEGTHIQDIRWWLSFQLTP